MTPLWSLTQMMKKNRKGLNLLHPLTMRKDTLQFINTSQSHQYTLPLVKALMKRTSAVYLTWKHQLKRCPQPLTDQMTQDMKHKTQPLLMSMQTRTVSRTRTDRRHWPKPWKMTSVKPLGRRNQLKDPLRTWRKSQKLPSPFMRDSGMTGTKT